LRLVFYSLQQGDQVRVFLSGKGVEIDRIDDAAFEVKSRPRRYWMQEANFLSFSGCWRGSRLGR